MKTVPIKLLRYINSLRKKIIDLMFAKSYKEDVCLLIGPLFDAAASLQVPILMHLDYRKKVVFLGERLKLIPLLFDEYTLKN